ncbi:MULTISPECIES: hypothetical protein [unclassified Sphingomonas]|uniref:hypothetical protein n=1 Tax=unclassified Sphingomonas TaxID=196159 RepID=UPI0006F4A715|nr:MULTISPECIES: hypothetical protein [unclassified Sphingomonas]KQX20288.1 hypothetical protein ASD17_10520 [Sphingomonas sp. Root1294]KQY67538.1 hypothetical protein ASD39_10580 [Sphingomonas sp. Root50]KRB90915.1 hypothetical protein ASE22_11585 [Sphingomonas sp. Root720]
MPVGPVRCGLCSAPVAPDSNGCEQCGLAWIDGPPPAYDDPRLAAIATRRRLGFRRGLVRFEGLILGFETLRSLASRFDRTATLGPLTARLLGRVPVRILRSAVTLADFEARRSATKAPGHPPADVALGCIMRPADLPALVDLATGHGARFSAIAVMVDGGAADADRVRAALAAVPGAPRLAIDAAPLAGDFGAQRNRVQQRAGTRWILHLDTDETPDDRLAANLAAIVADADRHADKVVGFARLNLVDARPSAFYPDTQYRLVRSDVRFHNKVHESPLPGVDWRRVHRSLAGGLVHRLSRDRVRARSVQYEAIAEGAGRPRDERMLLDDWPDIPAEIRAPA